MMPLLFDSSNPFNIFPFDRSFSSSALRFEPFNVSNNALMDELDIVCSTLARRRAQEVPVFTSEKRARFLLQRITTTITPPFYSIKVVLNLKRLVVDVEHATAHRAVVVHAPHVDRHVFESIIQLETVLFSVNDIVSTSTCTHAPFVPILSADFDETMFGHDVTLEIEIE
jgi:hypothetical protein